MFLGHWGLSFCAKRAKPQISLGTWFLATQFPGMLWPIFVLLGWEHFRILHGSDVVMPYEFYDYPLSHGLAGSLAISALFAAVHFSFKRSPVSAALLFVAVSSHWLFDLLVHRPDLPLWFGSGSPKVGLGLGDRLPAYLLLEFGLFLAGFLYYLAVTTGRSRLQTSVLWILVTLLCFGQAYRIFGPTPVSELRVAIASQIQWLWVALAYWADRGTYLRRSRVDSHGSSALADANS